jgi:hypothetical protein
LAALGDLASMETLLRKEAEWNPEKTSHSDYAISKYGEMEIWHGQQEEIRCHIVNPENYYWPQLLQDQGSGLLLKKVANGLRYYTLGLLVS